MDCFADIDNPAELKLGEDKTRYLLKTRDDNRQAALILARQASRKLDIFTPDMEAALYDNDEFIDAVTRLALGSPHARIRILTSDIEPAIKYGHRLIETSRQLSSYIEIRLVHEDYRNSLEGYLLADDNGLLLRNVASRFEGSWSLHAPMEVRRRRDQFETIWERSSQHPDVRRLHL